MNENQKKGIRISALSLPLSCVIAYLLYWITFLLNLLQPTFFSVAPLSVTLLPILLVFNVIALIVGLGGNDHR